MWIDEERLVEVNPFTGVNIMDNEGNVLHTIPKKRVKSHGVGWGKIALGYDNGVVKLFSPEGKRLREYPAKRYPVETDICFLKWVDEERLLIGCDSGILLWNISDEDERVFRCPSGVTAGDYDPETKELMVGGYEDVYVWDIVTGEEKFHSYSGFVQKVFLPSYTVVETCSVTFYGRVKTAFPAVVLASCWCDSKFFLTTSEKKAYVFSREGKLEKEWELEFLMTRCSWNKEYNCLAVSSPTGMFTIYNSDTWEIHAQIPHTPIRDILWSPQGNYLATLEL